MEMFKKTHENELNNLEVDATEDITMKLLSSRFKKKALRVHPDKTGEKDDEEFKTLLKDYNKCTKALAEITNEDIEKEKNDIKDFFAKNNVAKENTNSYTVLVEKEKSSEWKEELQKMELVTEPKKLACGGIQYKTDVHGNTISMTHYENPKDGQAKIHMQGSMFHIKVFILESLPLMYKRLCAKSAKKNVKITKKPIMRKEM